VSAVAVATALFAGCSTKKDDSGSNTVGAGEVKTGPGITDKKITLGALTDLSGPFALLGANIVDAQQLYVDETNKAGGICGRQLEIEVRDHGYDVQKAVAAYTEIGPKVAAFVQVVGSPEVTALLDDFKRDQVLTFPQAWASTLLGRPEIQVVGPTYDIDMVNGVDFLVRTAKLARGDKVGHIYFQGEYGENALAGAKFAAEKAGLQIVEQKIKPTDLDMTAQVTALKAEGVKAILISTGPRQSASAVGVAAAQGLNVPVLSSLPGFTRQILDTPAAPALEKNFYLVGGLPAASSDIPGVVELAKHYKEKFTEPGKVFDTISLSGYVSAAVVGEALEAACREKDLTRSGIVAAHRSLRSIDLGLGPVYDFSDAAKPSTYKSYVLRPKKDSQGGLVIEEPAFEASAVREYPLP
jgi:ABC-type branched-subunit amino acid transport system substrate-binding protein